MRLSATLSVVLKKNFQQRMIVCRPQATAAKFELQSFFYSGSSKIADTHILNQENEK